MTTFRRLTLPVDGSAASRRGVDFAAQLARSEGAAVDVCSVLDDAAFMIPAAEGALVDPSPFIEAAGALTAKHLSAAVAHLRDAGVSAEGTVLHGFPVSEIDDFTRSRQSDAIVMGTNGRSGIERMFMGSVTMALLRITDVPVITVHSDDTLSSGPLLVAIDASPAAQAALDCAIGRACVMGVALRLLHVFDERLVDRLIVATGMRPQSAQQHALSEAELALAEAAERVRAAGVARTTEIARGVPADTILAVAQRHDVGGIAMGTHGRGALERLTIGSVADCIVRSSRVPVYVVRRRNAKPNQAQHTTPQDQQSAGMITF